MHFSKKSVIHCPNMECQKPIMSQIALVEGTTFVIRCYSCSKYVRIQTNFNHISKRVLKELKDRNIIKQYEET